MKHIGISNKLSDRSHSQLHKSSTTQNNMEESEVLSLSTTTFFETITKSFPNSPLPGKKRDLEKSLTFSSENQTKPHRSNGMTRHTTHTQMITPARKR